MGIKVAKFGGSSVAGPEQFQKVKAIIDADPERRVVVSSAAGKRSGDDHKLTDLLYLVHAHLTYGVSCEDILHTIEQRLYELRDSLGLRYQIEKDLDRLRASLPGPVGRRAEHHRGRAERAVRNRDPRPLRRLHRLIRKYPFPLPRNCLSHKSRTRRNPS